MAWIINSSHLNDKTCVILFVCFYLHKKGNMYFIVIAVCGIFSSAITEGVHPDLVYGWNYLDFDWPNSTFRDQYKSDGLYVKENIVLNSIKVYKGSVFVTVPRLESGVPATLNVLMKNEETSPLLRPYPTWETSPLLRPYPTWEIHNSDDCENLLFVSSIEIDPNTGYMWILDTGFFPRQTIIKVGKTPCPAKLVIYDINNDVEIHRHLFPPLVVGRGSFYLNDLVLDFVDNNARYAYITDTFDWKLIVYDHVMNLSYSFFDRSMQPEYNVVNVTIAGKQENVQSLGINGIAISPDFKHVYYSVLAGTSFYSIPTSILRDRRLDSLYFTFNVKELGRKVSPGDGMVCGRKNILYYSTLGPNAIYKWNIGGQTVSTASTRGSEVTKDIRMEWINSLTIDEQKYLWFSSRNIDPVFHNNSSDFNFFVWKVYVDDRSYMDFVKDPFPVQGANAIGVYTVTMLFSFLSYLYVT